MGVVLGIDPGLKGGLALVAIGSCDSGITFMRPTLLAVSEIPIFGEDAKRRVYVRGVMKFIRKFPPQVAYIERAGVFPGQGIASGFLYGRAVGALEATVQGLMIPLTPVEPRAWKRAYGLVKANKEESRQLALELFPSFKEEFGRKKDHGVAEAALIAWYGCTQMRRAVAAE